MRSRSRYLSVDGVPGRRDSVTASRRRRREQELQHVASRSARRPAPPVASFADVAAVLDDHRDRVLRGLGRGERDEPRVRRASPVVVCAVPVLPATVMPAICAAVPVPPRLLTTCTIMSRDRAPRSSAACGLPLLRRRSCSTVLPSASRDLVRRRAGCMITPPLAMPAATSAICERRGATSPWPMPASANCGLLLVERARPAGRCSPTAPGARSSGGALVDAELVHARAGTARRARGRAARTSCCTSATKLSLERAAARARRRSCEIGCPACGGGNDAQRRERALSGVRDAGVDAAAWSVTILNVEPGG